jgi:4-alpha-glucanotransferase
MRTRDGSEGSTPVALRTLAAGHGVECSYDDGDGVRHNADPDVVVRVLCALGVPISRVGQAAAVLAAEGRGPQESVDPVLALWVDRPSPVSVRLGTGADLRHTWVTLELENGEHQRRRFLSCVTRPGPDNGSGRNGFEIALPGDGALVPGYHRLSIEGPGIHEVSLVIAAPRCPEPERGWGAFLPLYALRGAEDWGIGRYRDLGELRSFAGDHGASFLGTLPLFPTFLEGPAADPSPYLPVTRLGWNEVHVDPSRLPELTISPEGRRLLASDALRARLERLRRSPMVDHVESLAAVRSVLEPLARALFEGPSSRRLEMESFLALRPHIARYAEFRAQRSTNGQGAAFLDATQYHQYAQWIAHLQLSEASGAGTGTGLYMDLPIGVHPNGFDPVDEPDVFVSEMHGGAPPDAFFQGGQDWAFPPLHPTGIRSNGYRYVITSLRHAMSHARLVRVDHVMGMHRMYWIPEGADAGRGVYVRYRQEELRALVALEAWKAGAAVVGEDLGTVPDGVRDAMDHDRMLRSWVFEFESTADEPLPEPPDRCLASWATHDLPPFAGFWEGSDIDDRQPGRPPSSAEAEGERADRVRWRRAVAEALGVSPDSPADVFERWLVYLGAGSAREVMVDLEDLWLERQPQNHPGTGVERLNWRRRAASTLGQIRSSEEIGRLLRILDKARGDKPVETTRMADRIAVVRR